MADSRWDFLSHLVIRRTGLPFEWLVGLRFPRTVAVVQQLVEAERVAAALKSKTLREVFPQAVNAVRPLGDARPRLRALSRLRQQVGRGDPITPEHLAVARMAGTAALEQALSQLDAAVRRREGLASVGPPIFAAELRERRAEFRRLVGEPRFGEAVFLSNPQMYATGLERYLAQPPDSPRTAKVKMLERRLMAYLQRFCAKNDTASFFGPMNCGQLDPSAADALRLSEPQAKFRQRETFFAFWGTVALAEAIGRDPEAWPHLPLRPNPLAHFDSDGRGVLQVVEKPVRLTPAQLELVRLADGTVTADHVLARDPAGRQAVERDLRALVGAHVLLNKIEVPSTIFHPLTWLIRLIESWPTGSSARACWLPALLELDERRREFASAGVGARAEILSALEARFAQLTGCPPRRSQGQMYADRTLLYEECAGTMNDFSLGDGLAAGFLRQLAPALDLSAAYGHLIWDHYRNLARQIFDQASADGTMSYARFTRAVQARVKEGTLPSTSPELDRFASRFTALLKEHGGSDARVIRLSQEEVSALVAELPRHMNLHASPDVMVAAANRTAFEHGDYTLVLGELHQFVFAWGSQLYFCPDQKSVETQVQEKIAAMPEYAGLATVLAARKHKGLMSEAFPGRFIETIARAARPVRETIPLSDLIVRRQDGELVLASQSTGQILRLYTAGDENLHLWAFAVPRVLSFPIRLGEHTPRIVVGDVVYQRETWELQASQVLPDAKEGGDGFALFTAAWRARERYGLPRCVFVRVPSEKKPYFVDFEDYFCLEILQQLLARDATVTITEMEPSEERLWLADAEGHYCCEFRALAFHCEGPSGR